MRRAITHLKQQLDNATKELCDKNVRTGELESELKRLIGEIAEEKKAKKAVGREVERLSNQLSELTQEKQDLEGEIEKLDKGIKSLNEQLNDTQQALATKERMLEQKEEEFRFDLQEMKSNHKTDMDKFKKQAEERLKDKEIAVLSVVKERIEQELFSSKEQQYMQDTDHIQEAVDEFMQPIYEKLGINNQLDISSEYTLEFGEEFTNQSSFLKLKPPYTSTPKTKETSTKKPLNLPESPIVGNNSPNLSGKKKSPRKSPKKKYNDENKENSEQSGSPNASFGNPNSSPLENRTNRFPHTLTM